MKRTAESDAMFLTIAEASKKTGISQFQIRQGVRGGTIPHICSGRVYLVNLPRYIEILDAESMSAAGRS